MHHTNKEKFEEICELIKHIDPNDDAIRQTLMLRTVTEKFRLNVKDEKLLSEIFDMFNVRALEDEEFILSLVIVITSRQLDSFSVNGKLLRHAMLSILQKNFQNADNFKRDHMEKFYNSIKLLGEYFNKARLSNGVPINIIGQSLLNLINVELEKELRNICHLKNDDFARLVLSQITLNGSLLKTRHKTEIEQVLFTVRKCLIELDSMSTKTKAFLIMTLDLYYSNFTNVGDSLEKMYQTFLLDDLKMTSTVKNECTIKAQENGKVQASLERMSITKKTDEGKRSSTITNQKLKLQIKPEPLRNGPSMPTRSGRTTPIRSGPSTPIKNPPRSPLKTSPPQRNISSSPKKMSPQELRNKKSPPMRNGSTSAPRTENAIERVKVQNVQSTNSSDVEQNSTNSSDAPSQNDENILRQQNSRSSTPSSTAPPAKYKVNNKVYFREENVENLTWNGETSYVEDPEDPDESISPKVNPYSSSFLNFLSSN